MLADPGDDDRVAAGELVEFLDDVLLLDGPVRVLFVGEGMLLLPGPELGEPRLPGRGLLAVEEPVHRLDELLEDDPGVADDGDVGGPYLADLRGVDVDVDHLRLRGEGRHVPGHPVVEPGTDRHEEVGALHRGDRCVVPVHAGHPEGEGVGVGEGPAGHEGRHDREVRLLGEATEPVGGVRLDDAAAGVEDGTLGFVDEPHRGLHLTGVALHRRLVAGQVDGAGSMPLHLGVEDVLRDVDEDGTGTTRGGEVEGLGDDVGELLDGGDEVVVLRTRHGDAPGVGLLEGVHPDRLRRHLAGDRHHRDRVHVGVLEGGDEVRRPRSGGRHAHAHPAGGVGVPGGHVAGTLFVSGQDVADGAVEEGVVGGQDRPAGHAEDDLDPFVFERSDEGLGSGEGLCHGRLRGRWSGARDVENPPWIRRVGRTRWARVRLAEDEYEAVGRHRGVRRWPVEYATPWDRVKPDGFPGTFGAEVGRRERNPRNQP